MSESPKKSPGQKGALALGKSTFRNLPGGLSYTCHWEGPQVSRGLIQVTFDSSSYPLNDHCRYARLIDPTQPRTFANLAFANEEPGVRVGPWPGWRGIPEFPKASLNAGGRSLDFRYQIWGDEITQGRLRGICYVDGGEQGEFMLTVYDPRLVPVSAEFFEIVRPEATPVSFTPSSDHPRLLVHEIDLPVLRDTGNPERRKALQRLLALPGRWDLSLKKTQESKIPPGPEGLSPEDRMLVAAYLMVLDPSEENVRRAHKEYFEYLRLTRSKNFEPLAIDTQSGEVLFLLCLGYDWLYHSLSQEEREEAQRWVWEVASVCWNHLGYAREDYAQAHFLGCGMGIVAFSLLFPDEHPKSREWGSYLLGVLHWIQSALPADGYHPHGINIWIYEMGFLLRWLELYKTAGGVDLWEDFSVLAATSHFRGAATSPDGMYGITMGDPQYRVGGDGWCHLLIAARTGSGEAQWLAYLLKDLPVDGVDFRSAPARRMVYEHLWLDPGIDPVEPDLGVTHFEDGGQVFVRTRDTLITFRSGPPVGEQRRSAGILGAYGHSDPCNGSFLVWSNGGLLMNGTGPVYRRDSALHNVVTVDGQGQIGDTAVWLPDFVPPAFIPSRPSVRRSGDMVCINADLAPSYLPHLGVQTMRRHLLIKSGKFILGADHIGLRGERVCEWNFHSWEELSPSTHPPDFSIGEGKLIVLYPGKLIWKIDNTSFVPAYPNDGRLDRSLGLSLKTDGVTLFWVLCLATELDVAMEQKGTDAYFTFSDGVKAFFTMKGFRFPGDHEEES